MLNCWLEEIIALWLAILSNPSIDSVKPIRKFFNDNLNSIRPILVSKLIILKENFRSHMRCWKTPDVF